MTRRLAAALAALLVAGAASAAQLDTVELPANDLVFDAVSGRVYASVPPVGPYGNNVVAIDPETRSIVASAFVGSSPNRLAVSDDGRFLYVGLDGAHTVRRVSLPDLEPGPLLVFPPIGDGPFWAEDIAVQPGDADVVVVAVQGGTGSQGLRVFAGGAALPGVVEENTNQIEFGDDPATLWAYENETSSFELRKIEIGSEGARVLSVTLGLVNSFLTTLRFDGGLLYDTVGGVTDPVARKTLGDYRSPKGGLGRGVAVDRARGRTYRLFPDRIEVYDRTRFLWLGEIPIPWQDGLTTWSLVRWGDERLAFATSFGQVVLVDARLPDRDADDAPDAVDNCIDAANAGQQDADFDGVGDACDARATEPDAGLRGCLGEIEALAQETTECREAVALLDSDGDGEHERTDRCAHTTPGASVDAAGCSLAQFCAATPAALCKLADWGNDEPKKPADCRLGGTKPNLVCESF